jgi:large subunit ribosomal protein L20
MRIKRGVVLRRRHKKVLKATKGYRMTKNRLFKVAHEAMMHAGQYSYDHRRRRPSQMRNLWIVRISAAAQKIGMSYSKLMGALKVKKIEIDRKVLADMAMNNFDAFAALVK